MNQKRTTSKSERNLKPGSKQSRCSHRGNDHTNFDRKLQRMSMLKSVVVLKNLFDVL